MSATTDLVQRLRDNRGGHINGLYDFRAADTIEALQAERDALSLLLGDVASALEYHQEQTRQIHSTKVALDAYRAARTGSKT